MDRQMELSVAEQVYSLPKLPRFTGDSGAEQFVKEARLFLHLQPMPAASAVTWILGALEGRAREDVFDRAPTTINTPDKLLTVIWQKWGEQRNSTTLAAAFYRRQQGLGETVEEYAAELCRLYNLANAARPSILADDMLRDVFIQGLQPAALRRDLKRYARLTAGQTFEDVRKEALRSVREDLTDVSAAAQISADLIPDLTQLTKQLTARINQQVAAMVEKYHTPPYQRLESPHAAPQQQPVKLQRKSICLWCSRRGHTENVCRAKVNYFSHINGQPLQPHWRHHAPPHPQCPCRLPSVKTEKIINHTAANQKGQNREKRYVPPTLRKTLNSVTKPKSSMTKLSFTNAPTKRLTSPNVVSKQKKQHVDHTAMKFGCETLTGSQRPTVFGCKVCSYSTASRTPLRQHMSSHDDKKFQCKACRYRCKTASHLEHHMYTHSDNKPIHCSGCGYSGTHNFHMKARLIKHETDDPYLCKLCNAVYNTQESPNGHISGYKNMTCQRNYTDKLCGDFKQQVLTRATDKLLKCTICHYTCKRQGRMKAHIKIHSQDQKLQQREVGVIHCLRVARLKNLKVMHINAGALHGKGCSSFYLLPARLKSHTHDNVRSTTAQSPYALKTLSWYDQQKLVRQTEENTLTFANIQATHSLERKADRKTEKMDLDQFSSVDAVTKKIPVGTYPSKTTEGDQNYILQGNTPVPRDIAMTQETYQRSVLIQPSDTPLTAHKQHIYTPTGGLPKNVLIRPRQFKPPDKLKSLINQSQNQKSRQQALSREP